MLGQKHKYFSKLNYTLSNEDTRIEYELLPEGASAVFAVSGSGARVLPLLARNPVTLDVVDLSPEQLFLCELRIEAARKLSYEEFLFFLGYRGGLPSGDPKSDETGDSRLKLFERLELSVDCMRFWMENAKYWTPHGFILLGRWESHFQKLGRIFRNQLRMNIKPVFEAQSLKEQQGLYQKHWRPLVFQSFLRVVASEFVFNRFLYKGHFSGASHRTTEKRAPWKFLQDQFHRLFTESLVRKNYFLQILFLGRIDYEEGLPLEAQAHIISAIKRSTTRVNFIAGDLLAHAIKKPYDFLSLSDTISYIPAEPARAILSTLHADTPPGAQAVIRSFLRAPAIEIPPHWTKDHVEESSATKQDGTGVYQFHIFRKH